MMLTPSVTNQRQSYFRVITNKSTLILFHTIPSCEQFVLLLVPAGFKGFENCQSVIFLPQGPRTKQPRLLENQGYVWKQYSLYVCTFECVVFVYFLVGQPQISLFRTASTLFFETGCFIGLRLIELTWLPGQQSPGVCPSLPHPAPGQQVQTTILPLSHGIWGSSMGVLTLVWHPFAQ